MSHHPDYRFIVALRENDSRTLEELYRDCSPKISSWVLKNSGTAADARDLFQEALLSLHASAHKPDFTLTCPIGALLFTICRNQWINQLRRKKREAEVRKIEAERYTPESSTVSDYERWEDDHLEKKRLDRSLAQLSATCQRLLKLLGQGLSPTEVAERMEMPNANTVYRRKNACVSRWRKLFEASKGDQT